MSQASRITRRIVGLLSARDADLQLDAVTDNRVPHLIKWPLDVVLRIAIVCLSSGCNSLLQAEERTVEMTPDIRHKLRILRRISDTTLRTILAGQDPEQIRNVIHRQIRAAARRKALLPDDLPFNVAMLDGKSTALPSCDDFYAQRQTQDGKLIGMLRTMTVSLVTTAAQPCIDAIPIPAHTNEMGWFCRCVDALISAYGSIDLFRMVAADAGNCCESNARHVRDIGLHYLFGLKGNQPSLEAEAVRVLGHLETPTARSCDTFGATRRVERRLYLTEQMAGFDWDHLSTVVRVESRTFMHGKLTEWEDRYFVCSLPMSRLSSKQWLRLIRLLWGVENAVHCTADKMMREDDHPWIEADPKGALIVALLRRIAYNLLTLFRSVTLRADRGRSTPWKTLMRWVEVALLTAGPNDVVRLRPRTAAVVGTS
jgi:predicted transposase YbfD/YdcC